MGTPPAIEEVVEILSSIAEYALLTKPPPEIPIIW